MLAFTLVELLVVVLILGALAFVAIPRIGQSAYNAKKRVCETNIDLLNSAIETYYTTNGVFPADLDVIKFDTDLFPDGKPYCPITGQGYRTELTAEHRVNENSHDNH